MSWTNVNTQKQVRPALSAYQNLTIAVSTQLYWPIETLEGAPYVADMIDVVASAGSLNLTMPDARNGALGLQSIITNTGSNTFTVTDSTGASIVSISTTQAWIVSLVDNSTAAGTWRATQLGSTTSNATASSLAGAGLAASGSVLRTNDVTADLSSNTNITAAYRAKVIVWTGATGTLTLDTLANNGIGWYCWIINEGTGPLTIATSGSDSINTGVVTLVVPVGSGGVCFGVRVSASSTNYNISGGVGLPLLPSAGGTGAVNNAANVLTFNGNHALNFTLGADTNVTLPASGTLATLGMNIFTGLQQVENGVQVVRNSIYSDTFKGIVTSSGVAANLFNMPVVSSNLVEGIMLVYAYYGAGVGVGGLIMNSSNTAVILDQWYANTSFAVSGQLSLVGTPGTANSWYVQVTQSSGSSQTYQGGYLATCGPVSF